MIGYIDSLTYSGGSVVLGGWVRSPDGAGVMVVARKSAAIISSTLAERPRAEVPNAKAFSLALPLGVDAATILDGTVVLTTDAAATQLPVYTRLADQIRQIPQQKPLPKPTSPVDISYVGMAVGTTSPTGSVIVGPNGFLFVKGGSNALEQQYRMEQTTADQLAEKWTHLIKARHNDIAACGAKFIQIIIPEKSTTLHTLCPFEAGDGTPLLTALERRLIELPYFVNGHELLGRDCHPDAFMKTNSHLSPTGYLTIFKSCLHRLGVSLAGRVPMTGSAIESSDLSPHFHGLAFYDRTSSPEGPFIEQIQRDLRLVELHEVDQHVGTRFRYHNPTAPHKMNVLAFANSFFERGHSPFGLSWWFARWFESFTFVWSPKLDYDMVRSERPDIVVCQTIERFLPTVPTDD